MLVDPADYQPVLEKLEQGGVELAERKRLAQKAFQHVATYDTAISQYLRQDTEGFPEEMTIALKKRYSLRYGENPHQQAAFYTEQMVGASRETGVARARQLWGKELSVTQAGYLDFRKVKGGFLVQMPDSLALSLPIAPLT
ncbi:Bifunctional purine biosynthesis protein PurH [subsurface metagenome]